MVTPEEAVAQIRAYLEVCPLERYYNWTIPPGVPAAEMNPYLELFANEVMPHFR